jgi:beta-mannanase
MVGKKVNIFSLFVSWAQNFPLDLSSNIGQAGKTLIIFWEPSFGYDSINNGSQDAYIKQFVADAKTYGHPVILVPFDEMNLNEEAWGYGQNNNSAEKFKEAWIHIHTLFAQDTNVKFGLDYNNVDIPADTSGNLYDDYYPGSSYVDFVGVDGFSFSNNWQTFGQIFDSAINKLNSYKKPIIIFSVAAEDNPQKAAWITDGLGSHIKTYKNVKDWVWFNKGGTPNWLVNSDPKSLAAFKSVLP